MSNFTTVKLYIYDISFGLASAYGSSLLGKQIDGVWHTGVGVYGREYLFGSGGVSYTGPEEIYRQGLAPKPKSKDLGQTTKTLAEIQSWIFEKSSSNFRGDHYDLLDWNCNNFSDEFTKFLLNSSTSLIPEEILELPRFVKTTPLGRMLLSFLNKDPISMAQRSGTTNDNTASNVSMHMINSTTSNNQTSARQNILPVMNKNEERIPLIERLSNRSLSQDEKELLNEIQVLFRSDATYSPILNKKHLTLLVSLMINSISDQNGQKIILQVLQLLSEYEYIVKLFTEMKGEENPVDLLKSLSEQAEPIQIEFLRWFSAIAATSNGRTMLVEIQDDLSPIFTDLLLDESTTMKIKYEIVVILHNLLCINTDIRLSLTNTLSIGTALAQMMINVLNEHEAEVYLAVFIALADVEQDLYGIAKAMDFDPTIYSSIVGCRSMVEKIEKTFQTV